MSTPTPCRFDPDSSWCATHERYRRKDIIEARCPESPPGPTGGHDAMIYQLPGTRISLVLCPCGWRTYAPAEFEDAVSLMHTGHAVKGLVLYWPDRWGMQEVLKQDEE